VHLVEGRSATPEKRGSRKKPLDGEERGPSKIDTLRSLIACRLFSLLLLLGGENEGKKASQKRKEKKGSAWEGSGERIEKTFSVFPVTRRVSFLHRKIFLRRENRAGKTLLEGREARSPCRRAAEKDESLRT